MYPHRRIALDVKLLQRPSALAPVIMSTLALALVLVHLALAGTARQADEGAAAHLFQLLLAGQLPIVAFFALKWLRRMPGPAAAVLALQVLMALAACAPVWYFGL